MNALIEEMNAVRDANTILLHVVCDTDMSLQGFMIIERVQKRLIHRQIEILLVLQQRAVQRLGRIFPKGIHP